jgi:hypothetical protein
MVAASIIKQDRDSNLYTVPEQYKDIIMTNMGFAPALFAMGMRSKAVKEAFKNDGPYGKSIHFSKQIGSRNNRVSIIFDNLI